MWCIGQNMADDWLLNCTLNNDSRYTVVSLTVTVESFAVLTFVVVMVLKRTAKDEHLCYYNHCNHSNHTATGQCTMKIFPWNTWWGWKCKSLAQWNFPKQVLVLFSFFIWHLLPLITLMCVALLIKYVMSAVRHMYNITWRWKKLPMV